MLVLAACAGGIDALAAAMACLQLMMLIPNWRFLVFPACSASLRETLAPLATATLVASMAAIASRLLVNGIEQAHLRLAAGALTMAVVYAIGSYLFNRHWWRTMVEMISLRGRA